MNVKKHIESIHTPSSLNCHLKSLMKQNKEEHKSSPTISLTPSPANKWDSCNKSFYTTMNVKKHVEPEHAPSKPPLQCSGCNKHFPANDTYKHIREEPDHCVECGKSFLNDDNYGDLLDCTIFPEPAAESSSTPVIQNNKVQNKADLPNSMTLDEFLQRNAPILPSAHNSGCAVFGYKATMKESLA